MRRIDAVVIDEHVGLYLLQTQFDEAQTKQLSMTQVPLVLKPFYVICSKQHADAQHFIDLFNQGLANIQASGVYDEILRDL